MRTCLVCNGTGVIAKDDTDDCPACDRRGKIEDPEHDALAERVKALEETSDRMSRAFAKLVAVMFPN